MHPIFVKNWIIIMTIIKDKFRIHQGIQDASIQDAYNYYSVMLINAKKIKNYLTLIFKNQSFILIISFQSFDLLPYFDRMATYIIILNANIIKFIIKQRFSSQITIMYYHE